MKANTHIIHNKLVMLFLLAGFMLLVTSVSYSISSQSGNNSQQSSESQKKYCVVPKSNSEFNAIASVYCSHVPCNDCACISHCTHNHSGKLSFIKLIPSSVFLTIHRKIRATPLMLAAGMMGQPFRPPISFLN